MFFVDFINILKYMIIVNLNFLRSLYDLLLEQLKLVNFVINIVYLIVLLFY